ncbi:MAG TPA: HAD-IA family hydrolase [Verrucomicrobiae bacterium]|jgi:HAD superfamily hydrolase (TIGR01509 family)|nr:HAD-IA family hydrolase [Verrucomicrobiae bacterium]
MTQAIIFDCFGVLTTEGWIAFKNKHFGGQPEKMKRATELSRMLNSGYMGYEDSVREIAALAGVKPDVLDHVLRNVAANDELLGYIREALKPKYKIGLLSNVGTNRLGSIFVDNDIALFDVILLSHELGIIKPDPRSYETMALKLGIALEDCVFVDDLERNVNGARSAGMQAVRYHDFEQMKADLEELLANPKG